MSETASQLVERRVKEARLALDVYTANGRLASFGAPAIGELVIGLLHLAERAAGVLPSEMDAWVAAALTSYENESREADEET